MHHFINKQINMVPTQRKARRSKSELVDAVPFDRSPKNSDVARIVNLKPGMRMLIEVEALAVEDRACVAGNLCIIDGPNHQSFPDLLLQIHEIRYKS